MLGNFCRSFSILIVCSVYFRDRSVVEIQQRDALSITAVAVISPGRHVEIDLLDANLLLGTRLFYKYILSSINCSQ